MNNNDDRVPQDIEYGPPETRKRCDQYLKVLSSKHRRQTLRYLQKNPHTDVEEIAEHLHTHVSEGGVDKLEIDLVHNHLPALREHRLLSFDSRSLEVRCESLPDFVEEILASTSETTPEQ